MARWRRLSLSVILTFALVAAGLLSADAAFVGPRRALLGGQTTENNPSGACIGRIDFSTGCAFPF